MRSDASSPKEYIDQLPEERRKALSSLRKVIRKNIPKGFRETMGYGMIAYVVPHSIFPDGYHCDPKLPLPFMNLASQKNFVGVYHMGIYSDPKLMKWFVNEFPKHCPYKLDMGKSCIRFKKMDSLPIELIGELASKISVDQWISIYKKSVQRRN